MTCKGDIISPCKETHVGPRYPPFGGPNFKKKILRGGIMEVTQRCSTCNRALRVIRTPYEAVRLKLQLLARTVRDYADFKSHISQYRSTYMGNPIPVEFRNWTFDHLKRFYDTEQLKKDGGIYARKGCCR